MQRLGGFGTSEGGAGGGGDGTGIAEKEFMRQTGFERRDKQL